MSYQAERLRDALKLLDDFTGRRDDMGWQVYGNMVRQSRSPHYNRSLPRQLKLGEQITTPRHKTFAERRALFERDVKWVMARLKEDGSCTRTDDTHGDVNMTRPETIYEYLSNQNRFLDIRHVKEAIWRKKNQAS